MRDEGEHAAAATAALPRAHGLHARPRSSSRARSRRAARSRRPARRRRAGRTASAQSSAPPAYCAPGPSKPWTACRARSPARTSRRCEPQKNERSQSRWLGFATRRNSNATPRKISAEQHDDDRQVERRHDDRIGHRERRQTGRCRRAPARSRCRPRTGRRSSSSGRGRARRGRTGRGCRCPGRSRRAGRTERDRDADERPDHGSEESTRHRPPLRSGRRSLGGARDSGRDGTPSAGLRSARRALAEPAGRGSSMPIDEHDRVDDHEQR